MLDEGCTPVQIDKVAKKFGFAMGPFRMGDLAGNDIGWAIRKRKLAENSKAKYSKSEDLLCELGRFGHKLALVGTTTWLANAMPSNRLSCWN